ncbi:unnamed protein product [Symbiodinium sp. CCMP2456]|nr:unnamed protein product [Symbiodinium sp. CCMP2456]
MRSWVLRLCACQVLGRRSFLERSQLREAVVTWERNVSARTELTNEFGNISEWDISAMSNMSGVFAGLESFNEDLTAWQTSQVTDMSFLFAGASSFNRSLSSWSTSKVTTMRAMFYNATAYNQPLRSWVTTAVIDMSYMFYGAHRFNQPLDTWNTQRVTDMSYMFCGASAFDQPLCMWTTSAVQNMSGMFEDAWAYNNNYERGLGYKFLSEKSTTKAFGWDTSSVTDMSSMFKGARSFNRPIGRWVTSAVTSMRSMFSGATAFDHLLMHWDVSRVTDMSFMFEGASSFKQPLFLWNTSAVQNMTSMFQDAKFFNHALSSWNVSAVRDMRGMFRRALSYNQPLDLWDTAKVTDMTGMFQGAMAFNQRIGNWDTSRVTSMGSMFLDASTFNQAIGSWCVSAVVDLSRMFSRAASFNQRLPWDTRAVKNFSSMFEEAWTFNEPVESWNTTAAVDMRSMFCFADRFNQPLSTWNTSSVTDMSFMFAGAPAFDQPLSTWDTASVKNMSGMFFHAWSFNQPLESWNTASVTDMSRMFACAADFNQPIGSWHTSSVTNISGMFQRAGRFNQPLSSWNTSAVRDMTDIFSKAFSFDQSLSPWHVAQAVGAKTVLKDGGFGSCRRLGMFKSWDLDFSYEHLPHIGCAGCGDGAPCPDHGLACLQKMCVPMVQGFLELGRADWSSDEQIFAGKVGFRACAKLCRDSQQCTGFLLRSDDGCLQLRGQMPRYILEGKVMGDLAYWKQTCSTLSCPACWATGADVPYGTEVNEATCCECADDHMVQDWMSAPVLKCMPCPAGHQPLENRSGCRLCRAGYVAPRGSSQCKPCFPNFVPSQTQESCVACPKNMYAFAEDVVCRSCKFPYVFLNGGCIWWHWPVIVAGLLVLLGLLRKTASSMKKRRWRKLRERLGKVESIMRGLEWELWDEQPDTVDRYVTILEALDVSAAEVFEKMANIRAAQSLRSGVSLRYLLSSDFARLASDRTGERNPTFNRMKETFWLQGDPIGQSIICPRDGRLGCALVDWLPRADRREQTHYLSWTWMYTLDKLRSALEMFASSCMESHLVFFYMCFFVNNQFRIIRDGSVSGSQDLEHTFRQNLTRTGHVVAVLDTWHEPIYLTRIWTVYEQFVACTLQVPVTFVMPQASMASLQLKILQGEVGLKEVTDSVCNVNSAMAEAWDSRDEAKVKATIQDTVGFEYVNRHVRKAMLQWIGTVVREQFQNLVDQAQERSRQELGDRSPFTV